MTDDRARVFYAAQVRKGQRVLITTADDPKTVADKERIVSLLHERFPGVSFTLLCGVTGIAIEDGDDGKRRRR